MNNKSEKKETIFVLFFSMIIKVFILSWKLQNYFSWSKAELFTRPSRLLYPLKIRLQLKIFKLISQQKKNLVENINFCLNRHSKKFNMKYHLTHSNDCHVYWFWLKNKICLLAKFIRCKIFSTLRVFKSHFFIECSVSSVQITDEKVSQWFISITRLIPMTIFGTLCKTKKKKIHTQRQSSSSFIMAGTTTLQNIIATRVLPKLLKTWKNNSKFSKGWRKRAFDNFYQLKMCPFIWNKFYYDLLFASLILPNY